MTQHEIKTVLTRVGEGTKIILTGDIEQIDNVYIDATNNGLSYVVERLKEEHDDITLVTAKIDEKLNENWYIVPGLGDMGDRLFGTT